MGSKNQIKEVSAGKYDGIAVPVNSYGEDSESNNSLGEITLAFEFNKPLSPEKIGQLTAMDNAIYEASLSCGANCLALGKKLENCSAGINVISLIKNSYASLNSCSENLVNLSAFDLCFLTSSSRNSGAMNLNLFNIEFIENTEEATPSHIKEEITTFASTTNLLDIVYISEDNSSYLLANDVLTSLANSSACFSVNCDFETICLNRISLESLFTKILLTSIDKSKLGIALNSDSNSSGILILNSFMLGDDVDNYLKLSEVVNTETNVDGEFWDGGNSLKMIY